eukprot:EG_transcript_444
MDRDAAEAYHTILRRLSGMEEFHHSIGREKMEALIAGLSDTADDSTQLTCLTELCNFLSISTEDTVSGFRSETFAPLLVQCMRREHNIDIMLLAARALTHMMEALPSSCNVVVGAGAVPVFCEKLLAIEFIDLAEQCLGALDKLSQEHPHVLLKEGALNAMLSFIDFFGISVQRKVVQTAANLCKRVPRNCFAMVQDSLPTLTNFLTYDDAKLVENTVLCFSRLVASVADDEAKLLAILTDRVLPNLLDLLRSRRGPAGSPDSRPDISPATATLILRTLDIAARSSLTLTGLLLDMGLTSLLAELLSTSNAPPADPERVQSPGGTPVVSSPGGSPPGPADPQGSPTQSSLSQKMNKASAASAEIIHETVTLFNDLLPAIQEGVLSEIQAARRPGGRPPARDCMMEFSEAEESPPGARLTSLHGHPLAPSRMDSAWVCDAPGECLRGLKRAAPGSHVGVPRWRCIAGCDWDICDRCLAFHCGAADGEGQGDHEEEDEEVADGDHTRAKKEKDKEKERKEREKKEKAKRQQKDAKKDKKEKEKEKERERERDKDKEKERAAKAEVPEAGKPNGRQQFYAEHPEHLQRIAENMPAMIRVYSSTMRSDIKARCLAVLAKAIHFLPAEPLQELLRALPISGFLAILLHTSDPYTLASALHVAQILMEKLPAVFRVYFVREGVLNEINLLATRHDGTAGASGRPGGALLGQLVAHAKEFAAKYFGHQAGAAEDASPDLLCSEVARHLNQIATSLEGFASKATEEQVADLQELCSVLSSEESVSTYEVLTSGIIPALLHYLTHKGGGGVCERHERASRLLLVLGRPCPAAVAAHEDSAGTFSPPQDGARISYLHLLVRKLQAALSQEENFPIYVNDYAENNMTSSTLNCLKMLMQPFKLMLVHDKGERPAADGEGAPKEEGRGTTVMVEPLATVGAVEDFILSKLLLAPAAGEAVAMKPQDEDMEAEEDEPPEEQQTAEIEPPKRVTRAQARQERERLERGLPPPQQMRDEKGDDTEGKTEQEQKEEEVEANSAMEEEGLQSESGKEDDDMDTSTEQSEKQPAKEAEKGRDHKKGKCKEAEGNGATSSASAASPAKPALRMGSNALLSGMTIFQCIHKYGTWRSPAEKHPADSAAHLTSRRMWDVCHTVHYSLPEDKGSGRASSPKRQGSSGEGAPAEADKSKDSERAEAMYAGLVTEGIANIDHAMDDTLEHMMTDLGHGITATTRNLLLLLRALNAVSTNHAPLLTFLAAVQEETEGGQALEPVSFSPLHESEFVSSKLTNKLLCQVHDPLLLCSGYLAASWCQTLAVECPFLFSFATRRTFFELSSFGATRAMLMLQERFAEQGEPAQFRFGRIQKQKIRLSRAHILESAMKVMTLYGSQKAFLEFEFFGEVGTGLGPTLEFYTLVSKALQASKLGVWRNEAAPEQSKKEPVEEADGMDLDEKVLEEEEEYVFS